jgi:malate/lactate dehydrogenase
MLDGEFGLSDVCLGVPCIVSSKGVDRIIESSLPEQELAALYSSAAILMQAQRQLENA